MAAQDIKLDTYCTADIATPYCYYVSLSPETQSQQRLEWAQELADLDTEISQLEATLRSKVRSGELLVRT